MKNQKLIEKLNTIAQVDNSWQNEVVFYEKNKEWLNRSAKIAIKILRTLRKNSEEGKFPSTQKELAELLKISPQQVNKIVKGSENLTIETICKIENVLHIHVFEYEMA
jgi:DNA-binding XRE family transcriptional regulator